MEENTLDALISAIYSGYQVHVENAEFLKQRSILASKNDNVDEVNDVMIRLISRELRQFASANLIAPADGAALAASLPQKLFYPVNFLNTLKFSGVASHTLELKVGVPIILPRKFDQPTELCNGTRLIVTRLGQRVIEAEIITGGNVGKRFFILRII